VPTVAHRYLLDTNIVSDLVRDPQGVVARRIARAGEDAVCTSIVVACELRYGAAKKGSPRLTEQLESILQALAVLPLEPGADRHYGEIRAHLESAGRPIGANDLLIAAHARAAGLQLVTRNLDEFSRVPGLKVTIWPASTKRLAALGGTEPRMRPIPRRRGR
jgi:tRNA(fMet)-specific endonuclease VapC